jgi:hypothetical protein
MGQYAQTDSHIEIYDDMRECVLARQREGDMNQISPVAGLPVLDLSRSDADKADQGVPGE